MQWEIKYTVGNRMLKTTTVQPTEERAIKYFKREFEKPSKGYFKFVSVKAYEEPPKKRTTYLEYDY